MLTITLTIAHTRQMTAREFIAGIAAHLGIPYQKAAEYAYEEAKRIVDGVPRLAKVRVPVPMLGQRFDEVG